MKQIVVTVLMLVGFGVSSVAFLAPSLVYADAKSDLCAGANAATGAAAPGATSGCGDSTKTINDTVTSFIQLFSSIIGVIAVVMMMIGGFRYVTAGGDSGKVSGAKSTIMYALIGLVVVAMAQAVVHFVLNRVPAA